MFSESQQRRKLVKAAIREGEAPAEPSSWVTSNGRSGSAGASPSLQGAAIDFPRTGLPDGLTDDFLSMEISTRLICLKLCVGNDFRRINTKYGAVRLRSPQEVRFRVIHRGTGKSC